MISPSLICQRSRYQVLKASGSDIRPYLQSQITQDMQRLTPKHPIYTAVLTPQGKMVADMYILDIGKELMLIAPQAYAEALVERLRRFSMGHDIRLGIVDSLAILSIQTPQTFAIPENIQTSIQASMPMPEASDDGLWLVVEKGAIPQILAKLSSLDAFQICEDNEMDDACIVHGTPCFGRDWDASTHPLNANLVEMNGVSFDKGCYVGQEVTSRMHWRGGVKKKLYHVRIQGDLPQTPCNIQTTIAIGTLASAAKNKDGESYGIAHLPIESVEHHQSLSLENGTPIQVLKVCHA